MVVNFQGQEYNLEAVNDAVWVIRDETETMDGGIIIPDAAQKKPHTGDIKTVGKLVQDTKISTEKKAVFNQTSGQLIEIGGIEFTVLHSNDVTAVLSKK